MIFGDYLSGYSATYLEIKTQINKIRSNGPPWYGQKNKTEKDAFREVINKLIY